MTILAVDIMGSDAGPMTLMEGMHVFHQRLPECRFLIFGQEAFLEEGRQKFKDLCDVAEFMAIESFVDPRDLPSSVLRSKEKTSMGQAILAVAEGKADGVVSAGNTGAYLAMSRSLLKTLPGIDRPAIISQVPTQRGESVMLDLGGSLEAGSQALVQYAIMGHLFSQKVMGVSDPSVGILNVGKEAHKGREVLQVASSVLSQREDMRFLGFVEGDDIGLGMADVIVSDGFTGNIALKTGEGIFRLMFWAMRKNLESRGWRGKITAWLCRSFFKELKAHFDPRVYNGALWLGLNGIAVKSHGGTDSLGFAHALDMAYDMAEMNVVDAIRQALAEGETEVLTS